MPNINVGNTSIDLELEDGDLVLDTLIICRVVRHDHPEGESALVVGATDSTDWIIQSGMLHAALDVATEAD